MEDSPELAEMIPGATPMMGQRALVQAILRQRAAQGAPPPTMPQAQFSGYPSAPNPQQAAMRQQALIQMLRARSAQQPQMAQPAP